MKNKDNLKTLLAAYRAASKKADQLDEIWSIEPENKTLETAWDAAYKMQHETMINLADAIVAFAGALDKKTVLAIIRQKPQELNNLINRLQ